MNPLLPHRQSLQRVRSCWSRFELCLPFKMNDNATTKQTVKKMQRKDPLSLIIIQQPNMRYY
jgi:hypothetical protein